MSTFRTLHLLADRYRVDGQIAAGGMGEVGRARDLVAGRPGAGEGVRGQYVRAPDALGPGRGAGREAGMAGAAATPASDLYSLGIVAYECLAGAPPFDGTAMEVALAHQLRALPQLPGAVPAEAAGLVAGLTAKDPAARPSSAGEVAAQGGRIRDA